MAAPVKAVAKRVYDLVILGPDLGGAAAFALASKKGLRAVLVPLAPIAVARESEGWLLPSAPPLIPPLRWLSASAAALDETGLGADLQRQAAALPPQGGFQILSDKLRLSLPAEPSRRKAELRRELSDVGAAQAESALESLERLGRPWDAFLIEPPPWPARGFFERRRVAKIVPPPPELPEGLIGDCLAALAPFSASLVGDSAPEATAREAAALFRAPLRLWGGAAQLGELLRKKATEAGGEIFEGTAEGMRLDRKEIVVVLGGAEVRASSVVLACGAERIAALVQSGGRAERKVAEEAALPVGRKVTLAHFVVRAEGLGSSGSRAEGRAEAGKASHRRARVRRGLFRRAWAAAVGAFGARARAALLRPARGPPIGRSQPLANPHDFAAARGRRADRAAAGVRGARAGAVRLGGDLSWIRPRRADPRGARRGRAGGRPLGPQVGQRDLTS